MQGLYDPRLAQFLSPDNYIQNPTNAQNYNRYSYCLNNPLKYTDPSGNEYQYRTDFFGAFAVGMGGENWGSGGGATAMFGRGNYFAGADAYRPNYYYDWENRKYRNGLGKRVSWDEVFYNYVIPNRERNGKEALASILNRHNTINAQNSFTLSGEVPFSVYLENARKYIANGGAKNDILLKQKIYKIFGVVTGNYGINKITTVPREDWGMTTSRIDAIFVYLDNENNIKSADGIFDRTTQYLYVASGALYLNGSLDLGFRATVGHELIHAYNYYNLGSECYNSDYSESVAYWYSYAIYEQANSTIGMQQIIDAATERGVWLLPYPEEYNTVFNVINLGIHPNH